MGGGGACRCGGAFGAVGWFVSLSREGCVVLGDVGASTRGGGLALVIAAVQLPTLSLTSEGKGSCKFVGGKI